MSIEFIPFLYELRSNLPLTITVILVLLVILVNGWTDAPNAIATCVSTRAMGVKSAIALAAIFNFLGVFVMTMLHATVAQTIFNMVDFSGDTRKSIIALCASLIAIVIWSTAAWAFGIPTSESHALIAGISGAAIALQGGMTGINRGEWMKVIYGLFLSSGLGFLLGYCISRCIQLVCNNMNRIRVNKSFRKMQIIGGASMAFMHGAQDGQKFMAVFMLGIFLVRGDARVSEFHIPIWLMLLCSLIMALGTSIGGYRIIKTVGMGMVKLDKYQGVAADLAGAISLFISTLLSIPVSTTHTKTTAIMGVGASKRLSSVNWNVVKDMVWAWILTFPGCGVVGYLMAYVFMRIF